MTGLFGLLLGGSATASPGGIREFEVGALFGDNMVLQRDMAVPVWGWGKMGAEIRVEFGGQTRTAMVGENGAWSTRLQAMPASSEGRTMTITASDPPFKASFSNVLVGEVWICSGQSNMDWSLSALAGRYDGEIASATDPALRLGMVEPLYAARPLDSTGTSWHSCTPEEANEFSAVALFFGRKLRKELKVPVGLVESARGGSPVEAWMSEAVLRRDFPEFHATLDTFPAVVEKTGGVFEKRRQSKVHGITQITPTVFYNAHIHPLIPYGMRGVIWYQGESNVGRAEQYARLFPAMIRQWREEWNQGSFPFYYVQIAPCEYKDGGGALLREAQMKSLSVPNTGMAVIMDLGDPKNIHPVEKKPVGERLALLALSGTYGQEGRVSSGPLYREASLEGAAIRIHFDHVGSGLASRDGKALSHFTISGEDRDFVEAEATIEGTTIRVSSPEVPRPVAVRFAFGCADIPNLMNREGLPASSFRTDLDL